MTDARLGDVDLGGGDLHLIRASLSGGQAPLGAFDAPPCIQQTHARRREASFGLSHGSLRLVALCLAALELGLRQRSVAAQLRGASELGRCQSRARFRSHDIRTRLLDLSARVARERESLRDSALGLTEARVHRMLGQDERCVRRGKARLRRFEIRLGRVEPRRRVAVVELDQHVTGRDSLVVAHQDTKDLPLHPGRDV